MNFKGAEKIGSTFHLLLLEGTGKKLDSEVRNMNGVQVEILRVTSDAFDENLIEMAQSAVSKAFPDYPVYFVDGTVVPADFKVEDKKKIHTLALNAALACKTELATRHSEFHDINLARLANDGTLNLNLSFQRQIIENPVMAPVRSDIRAEMVSKKNQNGQQNNSRIINQAGREVSISNLSAFVEVLWAPPAQQANFNPWAPNQPVTQCFALRTVVTDLVSQFAQTPACTILALSTVLALRDNNNYIQTFRPQMLVGTNIDMSDIGALNFEANLERSQGLNNNRFGPRIDTKSDAFKLEHLGPLAASLIQPGMMIALDCPEYGPQSWYLALFDLAAKGDENAARIIIRALNQLTNDRFDNYYNVNMPMFIDRGNRIHMGYWLDNSGTKRDIRDFDYLAVANLVGDKNPELIGEFSDTFLRKNLPLEMRLSARKKMIMALSNETAVFTGFAHRVTFSHQFMNAVSSAIRDSGLAVVINNQGNPTDFDNQRGVASFAQEGLIAPGVSAFNTIGGFGGMNMNAGNFGAQMGYRYR
jgi:hypothetical protein